VDIVRHGQIEQYKLMHKERNNMDKLNSWLTLGYEKLARENQMTIEEVKQATITIKNGEVTVKGKK
jgi:hypothetical protein